MDVIYYLLLPVLPLLYIYSKRLISLFPKLGRPESPHPDVVHHYVKHALVRIVDDLMHLYYVAMLLEIRIFGNLQVGNELGTPWRDHLR